MPVVSIYNTSLEIDNTGKNIYINNETDYINFVYLCNNFDYNNTHKKVFHITKNLTFTNLNQPEPIKNFYHVLDGHGFTIEGIVSENISVSSGVSEDYNIGLLIQNNYGTVRNIYLKNCSLSFNSATNVPPEELFGVGLIVGKNYPGSKIKNCKIYSTCSITGTPEYFYGPFCGVNECGTIFGCVNGSSAILTQNMKYGCIAGMTGTNDIEVSVVGTISNCCNITSSGNITVTSSPKYFGGIVGLSTPTEYVQNCVQFISSLIDNITTSSSRFAGMIIGYIDNLTGESISGSLKISNCYYCSSSNNVGIGKIKNANGNEDINDGSYITKKTWASICDKTTYHKSYDFDNIWTTTKEFSNYDNGSEYDRPMLLHEFSISGFKDDTDWFDYKISKHQIRTASQLASLRNIINMENVKNRSKAYVFDQVGDITCNGKYFTHPIGTEENPFKEIYNGNGYKISGFLISGYINNRDSHISTDRACSIFGYNFGIIENIWVYNSKINPDGLSSTTLVDINRGNILNCKVSNCTIFNKWYRIGGLCNLNETEGYIANCSNEIGNTNNQLFGNVYNPDTEVHTHEFPGDMSDTTSYIGGICSRNNGKIYNCINKCCINSQTYYTGGICGINYGVISSCNEPRYFYDIDSHYVETYEDIMLEKETELYTYYIETTKNSAGGICGANYGKVMLCSNYYKYVKANSNAGGIVGMNYFQYSSTSGYLQSGTISECKNGDPYITTGVSDTNNCGGVIPYGDKLNYGGICGLSFNGLVKNCYNMVKLFDSDSGAKCVGGIVGKFSGTMENCYNIGPKPSTTGNYCGGIIGYIERYNNDSHDNLMLTNIKNCFNSSLNGTSSIGGYYNSASAFDITDSALTVSDDSLKDQTTFTGWNFDLVWEMDKYESPSNSNYEYPKIKETFEREIDNIIPKINTYQSLGVKNKRFKSVHAKEIYADKVDASVNMGKFYVKSGDTIFFDGGTPSVGRILNTTSNENEYLSEMILNYFDSPTQKSQNLNDSETHVLSSNTTIDCTNGNYIKFTLGANVTLTINASIDQDRLRIITFEITNGGAYTLTFNNNILWPNGTAPTLSTSGVDILRLYTADNGTTWFGTLLGKGFA